MEPQQLDESFLLKQAVGGENLKNLNIIYSALLIDSRDVRCPSSLRTCLSVGALDTIFWLRRNSVLIGFDGAQINLPEDPGHYYNLFSSDDGTQVLLRFFSVTFNAETVEFRKMVKITPHGLKKTWKLDVFISGFPSVNNGWSILPAANDSCYNALLVMQVKNAIKK